MGTILVWDRDTGRNNSRTRNKNKRLAQKRISKSMSI